MKPKKRIYKKVFTDGTWNRGYNTITSPALLQWKNAHPEYDVVSALVEENDNIVVRYAIRRDSHANKD